MWEFRKFSGEMTLFLQKNIESKPPFLMVRSQWKKSWGFSPASYVYVIPELFWSSLIDPIDSLWVKGLEASQLWRAMSKLLQASRKRRESVRRDTCLIVSVSLCLKNNHHFSGKSRSCSAWFYIRKSKQYGWLPPLMPDGIIKETCCESCDANSYQECIDGWNQDFIVDCVSHWGLLFHLSNGLAGRCCLLLGGTPRGCKSLSGGDLVVCYVFMET